MRALRWHAAGDVRLDEVPEPGPPAPGMAVVEVAACGICGSTDFKADCGIYKMKCGSGRYAEKIIVVLSVCIICYPERFVDGKSKH